MADYQRIELTLTAFEPQRADEANSELVNSNKFGVHELVQTDWVTKEITEDEFPLYSLCFDVDFDSEPIIALNKLYSHYPYVVLT